MAIFSIYIRYYNRNGSLVSGETKLYDVPFTQGNANVLIDPKVKEQMGKAGTFEFSIYKNHPYYDCWNQMKTMMRVEYYGETIFYGRVLTIDIEHLTSKKTIHCEGYLAFLIDTVIEGESDEKRERTDASTYITKLLNNHNEQVQGSVPPKAFQRGYLPGSYSGTDSSQQLKTDDSKKYGSTGWQDTASAFSDLTGEYGGYLRTRYSGGNVYLDWLDNYYNNTVGDRTIRVTKNAISMSSTADVENIFTVVLPIGKNTSDEAKTDSDVYLDPKFIKVPDIVNHYSAAELNVGYHTVEDYTSAINKYGLIYKTVSFPNAETATDLEAWAWDWIKNCYHGGYGTFTATAIDMVVTGESNNPIRIGDLCNVVYLDKDSHEVSRTLTVTSIEYDLHNPQNNSYTIGVPSDGMVNKTYGEKASKETSKKGGGGGGAENRTAAAAAGGRGGAGKVEDKVDHFFELYTLRASENNAEYQAYKQKYGDEQAQYRVLRSTALMLDRAFDDSADTISNKEARRHAISMLFDGSNGTMTGYNLPDWMKDSVFSPVMNEALSDWYTACASLSFDTVNQNISFKEFAQMSEQEYQEARVGGRHPYLERASRTIAAMGAKATGTVPGADKYGSITLSHVKRKNTTQEVETDVNTLVQEGLNGRVLAPYVQLPKSAGDALDQLASLSPNGTVLGTLNLNGPKAKMSATNFHDNTQETVAIEGNGTGAEGSVSAGWNFNKEKWRTIMNAKVDYLDKNNVQQTTKGFVLADDVKTTKYDSLNVRLLVVADLIADRATISQLNATNATIQNLDAQKADVSELNAVSATVQNLEATKADIADLNVTNQLVAKKADISELNATTVRVGKLESSVNSITDMWNSVSVVNSISTGPDGGISYSTVTLTFIGSVGI